MKALVAPAVAVLLVGLTVLCVRTGDGDPILALTPALVLGALCFSWWVPLRWPLLITTFLALTLEDPSETPACGQWKSPFYEVGAALLVHLNVTLQHYKALAFSGLDVILACLFVVAAVRYLRRSHEDGPPDADVGPIGWFAAASLGAAAWMWLYGMARGDADVASSLWQVQRVVYLPALVFLFQAGFRASRDGMALGTVVVSAACLKALLAIYIRATVAPPAGEPVLQYATSHADSMLFAVAFCAVLARVVHRRHHRVLLAGLVLPLLVAGMVANGRRLAWVELSFGVIVVAILTPWSATKRSLVRAGLASSPLLAVYAAIGWSSSSSLFQPIHTLRTVVDSKADPSTMWRDLENYDLFYTLRHNPIIGTGYGHGYDEIVWLPDISRSYSLYRFLPHNSILGLWAYGGLLGFTALWMILVAGLFLAARAYRSAVAADHRIAALTAVATIVVYLAYCYGDLGLGTWTGVFLVSPALAVSSRLAVRTGGWPTVVAPVVQIPIQVAEIRT